jgi:YVTN family beta-propeller protein
MPAGGTVRIVFGFSVLCCVTLAACGGEVEANHSGGGFREPSSPVVDSEESATAFVVPTRYPGSWPTSEKRRMRKVVTIRGRISPKSVTASPDGHVTAHNMMYNHSVTVYNRRHSRVATIPDAVVPAHFGYKKWKRELRGAPVEGAFGPDGRYLWVSNYSMYGPGFGPEGTDVCTPSSGFDPSFLYKIDTSKWVVKDIALVGTVPKFVQVTHDGRYVLVTNWCSWDMTIVDGRTMRRIATVPLGRYPRGIAITQDDSRAYVAVMGTSDVAIVDLSLALHGRPRKAVSWIRGVGVGPRHLNLSPDDRNLYITLNGAGTVAKVATRRKRVVDRVRTGEQPRSSTLSADGTALFVVNYESSTVSRVRTRDMVTVENVRVDHHPIGITYSGAAQEIWVASYGGSITVFADAKA